MRKVDGRPLEEVEDGGEDEYVLVLRRMMTRKREGRKTKRKQGVTKG